MRDHPFRNKAAPPGTHSSIWLNTRPPSREPTENPSSAGYECPSMKMAKSLKHQPHADVQSIEMSVSLLWITRIEIRFWQTVTPLMQRSRLLQFLIRFIYDLISGRSLKWVFGMSALFAVIMFAIGFITGLVYPLIAAF